MSLYDPAVRLFVGGQAHSIQGERDDLAGHRCFTAAHRPNHMSKQVNILLDSGAFTDPPHKRLTPEQALCRQMGWEQRVQVRAEAIVSYDLLIDEVWVLGKRTKRRWEVSKADSAVDVTVQAARYLAEQRDILSPRKLVLACQGVDSVQYSRCVSEVLSVARKGDWIGLGGWCILGRFTSWLPTFWATLYRVLPMIHTQGIEHVHIFGVLYLPALGGLLWLCDRYGLALSTDSSAPVLSPTRGNHKKAGVRAAYWRANVAWWQRELADLRFSEYYMQPPHFETARQLEFVA